MKKRLFIISLTLILLFSTLSMCFATSDIQVWAEVSTNIINNMEDPNVSDDMLASALNSNPKNKISNNTNSSNIVEDPNVSNEMLTSTLDNKNNNIKIYYKSSNMYNWYNTNLYYQ